MAIEATPLVADAILAYLNEHYDGKPGCLDALQEWLEDKVSDTIAEFAESKGYTLDEDQNTWNPPEPTPPALSVEWLDEEFTRLCEEAEAKNNGKLSREDVASLLQAMCEEHDVEGQLDDETYAVTWHWEG